MQHTHALNTLALTWTKKNVSAQLERSRKKNVNKKKGLKLESVKVLVNRIRKKKYYFGAGFLSWHQDFIKRVSEGNKRKNEEKPCVDKRN